MSSSPDPSVVERFDDYLRRRARSGLPLRPGETVTAVVGLLRGCRSARDRAAGAGWWLTADGRPVLRSQDEGDDAIASTAAALVLVAALTDDGGRALVERASEQIQTQPPRAWDESEKRLFAWAEPLPLVLGPLAPRLPATPEGDGAPPSTRPSPLLALVDADLAALVSRAVHDARDSLARHPRARVIALAIVAAVAVGAAALSVRPGDSGATAPVAGVSEAVDASPSSPRTPVAASPSPSTSGAARPATEGEAPSPSPTLAAPPSDIPEPAPAPGGGIVDAARALLAGYAACAGDASCEAGFREGSAAPRDARPVDPASADLALIDDFGGVAVVRADDGVTQQYLTLVRDNEKWLVRAVETVADQPS